MPSKFSQEKITDLLARKKFTVSVEVFPPRNGKPASIILDKLAVLSELPIDFVSVTKGAMGSMRGGTVPIGYMISERYKMNALVHFRCRDMDRREVENLLVDHMYFGTRNILAVLGDPLAGEKKKTLDPKTHNRYASELVRQISDMNKGRYLSLPEEPGAHRPGVKTDFCIGVACYPESDEPEKELFVIGQKAKAGANFGISQMVFSAEAYFDYLDKIRSAGIRIPIIPGIRPVTCQKHVHAAEEVFKANVPVSLKKSLKGKLESQARKLCLDFTVKLCGALKDGGAPGVHMFVLNDVEMAGEIIGEIRS